METENWDEEFLLDNLPLPAPATTVSLLDLNFRDEMELSDDDLDWNSNQNKQLKFLPNLIPPTVQVEAEQVEMAGLSGFSKMNLNSEFGNELQGKLQSLVQTGTGQFTRLNSTHSTTEEIDWDDDFEDNSKFISSGLNSNKPILGGEGIENVFVDQATLKGLNGGERKEESLDLDFDLPESMARITLSPTLTRSTNMNTLSVPSHIGSSALESGEEEDDDFFQDITLPSFMGGPGAMTPPSEGECSRGGRIDLQAMLRTKTAARTRKNELRDQQERRDSKEMNRLEGYMENLEGQDSGFELDDGFKIRPEKIKARGGPGMRRDRSTTLPPPPTRPPMSFGTRAPSVSNPSSTIMPSTSIFTSPKPPVRSNSVNTTRTFIRTSAVDSRLKRPAPAAPSQGLRDRYSSSARTIPNIIATSSTPPSAPRNRPASRAEGNRSITPTFPPSPVSSPTPRAIRVAHSSRSPSISTSSDLISPGPTMRGKSIERKPSLQNIQGEKRSTLLPPSTTTSSNTSPTKTLTRKPSSNFALPTSASSSRIRDRVKSVPSPLLVPTPLSPKPLRTLRSTPSSTKLSTFPSFASNPASPTKFSRTKAINRFGGDGTELDSFPDLPINESREERIVKKSVQLKRNSELISLEGKGKEKRVKGGSGPQLIRNLGVGRDQNGMVWNSTLLRWEGNEGILAKFERIPNTFIRPTLISPVLGTTLPTKAVNGTTPLEPSAGAGVKVVGGMRFDPIKMSWFSIKPLEEEELQFNDFDMEVDPSEGGEEDQWSKLETARNLKHRKSFLGSFGSEGGGGGDEDGPRRGEFWEECRKAENRHREEMRNWVPKRVGMVDEKREGLWDIWRLVLDE